MIAACQNVEDVVAESLVEWDGLKSRIYRRCCLHNGKYSLCSYYILVALILFLQSSS